MSAAVSMPEAERRSLNRVPSPRPITRLKAKRIALPRGLSFEAWRTAITDAAAAKLVARCGPHVYGRLGLFGLEQLRSDYGPARASRKLVVDLVRRRARAVVGDLRRGHFRSAAALEDGVLALVTLAAGWLPEAATVGTTFAVVHSTEYRSIRRERERQEDRAAAAVERGRKWERATRERKRRMKARENKAKKSSRDS